MLSDWEWLLFHLLKKCYFSHCIFLSLEIGLELTQIIIKSQEKQRKTTPASPLSALGRLCLSPLGCPDSGFLPFPWWKIVQWWLKTQAGGPTLCFLLHQSRAANDSCYPLWTPRSPQLPMVRSRSALEESFENERRWHVCSATHRGCKRAPELELQCTSCSHSCLSATPVSCSLHLCCVTDACGIHVCSLSLPLSGCSCLPSLSFTLPPSSVRRQKKVLQDLPSQCPSCLFHPFRSEDSPISHLIFPSSCSSHISLTSH